jgi:hypothetical protein
MMRTYRQSSCTMAIRTEDFTVIAGDVAARGRPVPIAMEGGYAADTPGANLASFLAGF